MKSIFIILVLIGYELICYDKITGKQIDLHTVGKGTFGQVVKFIYDGRTYCAKIFVNMSKKRELKKYARNEIARTKAFRESPYIVQYMGRGVTKGDHHFPYLLTPYYQDGDLAMFLAKNPDLPLSERVTIIKHVVQGILEMHRAGCVHLDIKPQNILIDAGGRGLAMWDTKSR